MAENGSRVDTIAIAASALLIGGGVYMYMQSQKKQEFSIGKPTANPGIIGPGDTTTISSAITSNSEETLDVTVKFTIKQAGTWPAVAGALIEEKSVVITIEPGSTVTASVTHTGTTGGPTNSGIAMRTVGVGVFVDSEEVGGGRLDADIFGVNISSETIAFSFGTPSVDKEEVQLNKVINITVPVTSNSSKAQTVRMSIVVRYTSLLAPASLGNTVGASYSSPSPVNINPGQTISVTFPYTALGEDGGRVIEVKLFLGSGATLTPDTQPNNPYVYPEGPQLNSQGLFQVKAIPSGVSLEFTLISVTSSLVTKTSGALDVFAGYPLTVVGKVKNSSSFPLENVKTALVIGGQTLTEPDTYTIQPNQAFDITFQWTAPASQGLKSAEHRLLMNGQTVGSQNYGYVCFVVVPKTLELYVIGTGDIAVQTPEGNPAPFYTLNGAMAFKTGTTLILRAVNGLFEKWSGDTGLGDYYLSSLPLTMDRNRVINAHFGDTPNPATYSFSLGGYYWRSNVAYWRLEHFNQNQMDGVSEIVPASQRLTLYNVHQYGNVGVAMYDASMNYITTWYSDEFSLVDGAMYNYYDNYGTIQRAG